MEKAIRWRIVLDTTKSVQEFVNILTKYPETFYVVDTEGNFRVDGKSMMGMLYSTEWRSDVYLTCDTEPHGLYNELAKFII